MNDAEIKARNGLANACREMKKAGYLGFYMFERDRIDTEGITSQCYRWTDKVTSKDFTRMISEMIYEFSEKFGEAPFKVISKILKEVEKLDKIPTLQLQK